MPRFSSKFLSAADREAWQALWVRTSSSLGLHWNWADFAAAKVGDPIRIGIFAADGQLIAGVMFVQRRRRMATEWHHPAPTAFAGVMAAEDMLASESSLRDVLQAVALAVPHSVSRADIVFAPGFQDTRELIWNGWKGSPHFNYESPIGAAGQLAADSENAARRQGTKARAAGYKLEIGDHLLVEIIPLWEQTRTRQNIPHYVHPECFGTFLQYCATNPDGGLSGFTVAMRNPETRLIDAAAIIGMDRSRAYYLLGAARLDGDDSEKNGAPTLLHFDITDKIFAERGAFVYDWVGANTASVAQFKKKFRPRLISHARATFKRGFSKFLPG